MVKYSFQVLLKAHEGGWSWYYPPGPRAEFDAPHEALRAGVQAYPDMDIRIAILHYEDNPRPHGRAAGPFGPEPHRVLRPSGKVRSAVWALFRGVADARAWRTKCSRCGMTGQAHWAPRSILTCRRFSP